MRKKRIAVVLHGLGANGIDTLFVSLSKKWDYDNFEVVYLLAVDKDAHQFGEDEVAANGVHIIHLHDLDKKGLFKWPITLRKALKEYGPFDAVHMNMDMLNGINSIVAKGVGIPVRICHAHNSSSEKANSFFKKIYVSVMKSLIRNNSTDLIACSQEAGEYFFGNSPFKIIFNGIDIKKYYKETESEQICKNGELSFVTVGRFSPQKRPFFILDTFEQIVEILPQAHLTWIGSGGLFDSVKKSAKEKGIADKIDFLGIRSDVNEILKKNDYFLFPSAYEGLGLALVEAQAAGLDCFATDTIPKISDCGKCKYISIKLSAKEWADKIVSFIHSNETMYVKQELLERFDIEKMARELEKAYGR